MIGTMASQPPSLRLNSGGPPTLMRKLLASNRKIEGLESTTARLPGQTSCRATAGWEERVYALPCSGL